MHHLTKLSRKLVLKIENQFLFHHHKIINKMVLKMVYYIWKSTSKQHSRPGLTLALNMMS
jgi:hypothetical protein